MILSAVLLVHCQYTCRRRNIRVKLYEISIHLYLDLIEFLYIHKSPYIEIYFFKYMYGLLFAFARMDPIFLRCSCLGIDSSNLFTLGQHGSCSFSGQGAWKGHWPFMGPWDGERWWGSCSYNSCFEGQVLFCHICELKIIDSYLEVDFVAVMSVGADGGMLCLHCVIRILFVYIYIEESVVGLAWHFLPGLFCICGCSSPDACIW